MDAAFALARGSMAHNYTGSLFVTLAAIYRSKMSEESEFKGQERILLSAVDSLHKTVNQIMTASSGEVRDKETFTDSFAKFRAALPLFELPRWRALSAEDRANAIFKLRSSAQSLAQLVHSEKPSNQTLRHLKDIDRHIDAIGLTSEIEETSRNNKIEYVRVDSDNEKRFSAGGRVAPEEKLTIRNSPEALNSELDTLWRKLNDLQRVASRIQAIEKKVSDGIEQKLHEIEALAADRLAVFQGNVDEVVKKTASAYEITIGDLEDKKKQAETLVGSIAGRVVAGDYAENAEAEKRYADLLRVGSLGCMAIIVGILLYSFYETIHPSFKWENTLFRLVLSLFLSVPAAYMARESGKHRAQQYSHQQTSLDLKAITPYLASLPEDEQHRLKAEFANRLFSPRDFSSVGNDAYPINAQEIIMALVGKVEKIDLSRNGSSESKA